MQSHVGRDYNAKKLFARVREVRRKQVLHEPVLCPVLTSILTLPPWCIKNQWRAPKANGLSADGLS